MLLLLFYFDKMQRYAILFFVYSYNLEYGKKV